MYYPTTLLFRIETSRALLTGVSHSEHAGSVAVSFGGQLSQNIALKLQELGNVKILGTDPRNIDKAEDRAKFSVSNTNNNLEQSCWGFWLT